MTRKILLSVAMLLFIALTLAVPLSEGAMAVHDAAFERSIGAFAIAKGLNAVISLLQGTELNATPAGVGITLTIGEILDPMNDMVERFSWIMLASSVSLGVQKILLTVGELTWIKISLSILTLVTVASLWYQPLRRKLPLTALLRLAVILIVLRFGATGYIHTENLIYTTLMQSQYQQSVIILDDAKSELDTIAAQSKKLPEVSKQESLLDSLGSSYARMKDFFDINARIDALTTTLDQAQREVLNLITIFVILNLLLPLLFLWIFLNLFKWAVTGRFDNDALHRWFYMPH